MTRAQREKLKYLDIRRDFLQLNPDLATTPPKTERPPKRLPRQYPYVPHPFIHPSTLTDEDRARIKRELRIIKAIASRRRRSAAMLATPGERRITRAQWAQIKRRYFYRCAYCYQAKPLTKDHVIPLSKGGAHTHWNIIPACRSCNSRKGNRDALQYNPLIFRKV